MDTRKLAHIVALAQELNFARAAKKVHLTQSALSRSVRALEDELGGRLFDRDRRGVTLTAIGRTVVQRAQGLLLDAGSLRREVELMQRCEFGDIRLGVGPFPSATFLPPVLAELARQYPRVRVEVEINNWQYLLQHLRDQNIELFISEVRNIPVDPRIAVKSFARQYGGLFCRAGHPLAGRRLRSAGEVLAYPFGSVKMPVDVYKQLTRYLGAKTPDDFALNLTCDNPTVTRFVALNSDTVLLSTYAAVKDDLADGGLVALDLPDMPRFHAEMGVISLAGRTLSPVADWLVARMQSRAEALAAEFSPRKQNKPPRHRDRHRG